MRFHTLYWSLPLVLLLSACDSPSAAEATAAKKAEPAAVPEIAVADAAQLLASGGAVAVDANNPETRTRFGVIPDARLLSSSSSYNLAELPADKSTSLVFYCANTRCTASDSAAGRALAAGYGDVKVLRAGIMGWREAGKPTVPPPT